MLEVEPAISSIFLLGLGLSSTHNLMFFLGWIGVCDRFLAADILSLVDLRLENPPLGDVQNLQVIVLHLFVVSF